MITYRWFVFILVAAVAVTIGLALWKAFGKQSYIGYHPGSGGHGPRPTFIGGLSWWAVPWPLFLAVAFLALPYIRLVIMWGGG